MESEPRYITAWANYRKRRRLTYLIPGILLLGSLEGDKVGKPVPFILFAGALITFGLLNHWYEAWKCPRCGEKYVEKRVNGHQPGCSRCTLPKWSESGATGL